MNCYQLNDCEFYAGNTAEEAIAAAMEDSGLPREDVVDEAVFTGEPVSLDMQVWEDERMTRKISVGEMLRTTTEPGFMFGVDW